MNIIGYIEAVKDADAEMARARNKRKDVLAAFAAEYAEHKLGDIIRPHPKGTLKFRLDSISAGDHFRGMQIYYRGSILKVDGTVGKKSYTLVATYAPDGTKLES